MKAFVLLMLLSTLIGSAFAQKIIEKRLPYSPSQLVNLNLKFADSIQVRYWDKSEISVRITVTINGGRLNDALLVETASTGQAVSLKTDFDQERIKQGKAEDCPGHQHSSSTYQDGTHYAVCSDINYVVYLPRRAKLNIETINGNINIEGAGEGVSAKSISGYVDMNWPRAKGANLAMKTITGEVYSNLDIDLKGKKEKHPIVGYLLKGTLMGGGPTVQLESISNNIYLRQQK